MDSELRMWVTLCGIGVIMYSIMFSLGFVIGRLW